MPNGRVHFIANGVGGIGLTFLAYTYLPDQWGYAAAGSLVGLFLTPDADIEGRTFTERLLRKIPLLGFLFQWGTYPYATLAAHRGYSHHILIGTLSRVVYTYLLLFLLLIIAVGILWRFERDAVIIKFLTDIFDTLSRHQHILFYLAWWLQDCNHYLLDWLSHETRRKRK